MEGFTNSTDVKQIHAVSEEIFERTAPQPGFFAARRPVGHFGFAGCAVLPFRNLVEVIFYRKQYSLIGGHESLAHNSIGR